MIFLNALSFRFLVSFSFSFSFSFFFSLSLLAAEPNEMPQGEKKSAKTNVLEAGAKILQSNAPVAGMDMYLVGLHPMKGNPNQQMEAHHFCHQVNEDFAQCALFDGNAKTAHLNGIEYIISEKLFGQLPKEERKYWHPHNYEILSGQLVAPGLPDFAEKELMKTKMNSYGKTWHVWNTGHFSGGKEKDQGDSLPFGEPMLAWSFNRDGEAAPGLVAAMEKELKFKTNEKRRLRSDLSGLAKPQEGVEAIK